MAYLLYFLSFFVLVSGTGMDISLLFFFVLCAQNIPN